MRRSTVLSSRLPKIQFAPTGQWGHDARWWEQTAPPQLNRDPNEEIVNLYAHRRGMKLKGYLSDVPLSHPPIRPERTPEQVAEIKQKLAAVQYVTSSEWTLRVEPRSQKYETIGTNELKRDAQMKLLQTPLRGAEQENAMTHYGALAELQGNTRQLSEDVEQKVEIMGRRHAFAEFNCLYFLPQPFRNAVRIVGDEKEDLKGRNLAGVSLGIEEWLPESYRFTPGIDISRAVAFDADAREKALKILDEEDANIHEGPLPARAVPFDADAREKALKILDEGPLPAEKTPMATLERMVILESAKNGVDPTRDITAESIEKVTDLEELRQMFHRVSDYNGDERVPKILARAAELSGDAQSKVNLDCATMATM